MPVLNLTKAEAFALLQTVHIESSAMHEAMHDGLMPRMDPDKLPEKISDIAPSRSEIAHLFKNERS